jgi:hypothetical protein
MDTWIPDSEIFPDQNPYGKGPFVIYGVEFILKCFHNPQTPLFFVKCGPEFQHWWPEEHGAMHFKDMRLAFEYRSFLLKGIKKGLPSDVITIEEVKPYRKMPVEVEQEVKRSFKQWATTYSGVAKPKKQTELRPRKVYFIQG